MKDDNRTWVNLSTGEIKDNVRRIYTDYQEGQIQDYKKQKEFQKHLVDFYGEFFFYKYDELLNYLDRNIGTAFRFLYVCSCADWENKIITSDRRLVTKNIDFVNIFNKPRQTSIDFHDALVQKELIYQDFNGIYRVNDHYYSRAIKNDNDFRRHSIRVFNRALQELYNMLSSDEHVFGGELLKLIPYMNIHNNILCANPTESDIDAIEPLSKETIQDILRPDSDYGRKLRLKLEKFSIHDEPVLGKFNAMQSYQYIINPRLFYRGNNINQLNAIIYHFDTSKAQTKKRTMKRRGNVEN